MLDKLSKIIIGIIQTRAIQQWLVRHRQRIQEQPPPQCIQLILLTIIIKVSMKRRILHMHHIHSLFIPLVSIFYYNLVLFIKYTVIPESKRPYGVCTVYFHLESFQFSGSETVQFLVLSSLRVFMTVYFLCPSTFSISFCKFQIFQILF